MYIVAVNLQLLTLHFHVLAVQIPAQIFMHISIHWLQFYDVSFSTRYFEEGVVVL